MKILSHEIKVNEETFVPEMIVTVSFPMERVKEGDFDYDRATFVYSNWEKAWEEYQNGRD